MLQATHLIMAVHENCS